MKKKIAYLILLLTVFQLFSFKENTACDLLNSNLGYAIKQATNAENAPSLHTLKYYTYKAVNTLQKLERNIDDCGCESAEIIIDKGLTGLKNATQSESISSAKLMVSQAKKDISTSIDSIKAFSSSTSITLENNNIEIITERSSLQNQLLYTRVDSILQPFKASMEAILHTDDCMEAYNITLSIYEKSEDKLLNETLSEAKKYYHLRTKEIAKNTLMALEDCAHIK